MKLIPLTRGRFAKVDNKDYETLMQYRWYTLKAPNTFYACARGNKNTEIKRGKTIYMHRLILGFPVGVDHKDRNGLNNQRLNLRVATHKENMKNKRCPTNNTSGYTGVSYKKTTNKYFAYIASDGKRFHLGYYRTKEVAAMVYNVIAKIHFGEFASLNEIKKGQLN